MQNESCGPGFYRGKQVENHGSNKKAYNKIFIIVIRDYKICELVHSFMFIFYPVQFSTYSTRGIIVMYVLPIISGCDL